MTWEDRLKQLIAPTENKFPYRVVQVKPNRRKDDEIYLLSGREEAIAANGSLFLALYDMAERDRINFEEWFAQWELGFPLFDQFREPENSNYPLSGKKSWRVFDKRPKFKDWTPPSIKGKYNFSVIEYWRDRSVENESVPLSGTAEQLIQHIIQIEYEGGASATATKGKGGNLPYLKGQPLITIEFVQDPDKVGISPTGNLIPPVAGTISFRIMDKTDDPKSALDKISKSDLKNYADRISREFGGNGGYVWEKGKAVVSYRNRSQGFEGWYLVKNKSDGIALVTKLLAITGQQIDTTRIKFSETENAEAAYPEIPVKATVLGEEVELARERPLVDVRFREASIHLPRTRKTIQLVLFANSVYK